MKPLLFVVLLLLTTPAYAQRGFEDGTLVFLENSCNSVESYTDSLYSHVAVIMSDEDGVQWLYNAEPPKVKRYKVADYFTEVGRMNEGTNSKVVTSILRPKRAYTDEESEKMRVFLEDQVDRRYSIRGYLRNISGDGIHCSELSAGALESAGRRIFRTKHYGISPGFLRKLVSVDYNMQGKKLLIRTKSEDRLSAYSRWSAYWKGRGTLCGWSCWEGVRFCW